MTTHTPNSRAGLYALGLVVFFILACATPYDRMASGNRQLMFQLRLEMSMDEVANLMGTKPLSSDINQPYRAETLKLPDGSSAVIWFYYSDRKAADNAITNDELSPVIFEKGKVVGWGWTYLDQNYNRYKIKIERGR